MALHTKVLRCSMVNFFGKNFYRNAAQKSCPDEKKRAGKPKDLVCFKDWSGNRVLRILNSALALKQVYPETSQLNLGLFPEYRVMTLLEVNNPILRVAVSKACMMMGARNMTIIDNVGWDTFYLGRIYSYMVDIIFVTTNTHWCLSRFAHDSQVPVLTMKSRTHAAIQAMSTLMTIMEDLGSIKCARIGYLGPMHPLLNSLLLLAPMLGADIRFKCHCDKSPISPVLEKESERLAKENSTKSIHCQTRREVFEEVNVIIAGPTTKFKEKLADFTINCSDMNDPEECLFIHTLPRGKECDDEIFNSDNSRTFEVFKNMPYIVSALIADALAEHVFECKDK